MTERTERNPLPQEVINHLRTIAKRGPIRVDDHRHGAVHGTSLATIRHLLDSGVIIGRSFQRPSGQYHQGDLSVYPTRTIADKIGHLTDPSIRELLEDFPNDALLSAKTYAQRTAQRHAFLTHLAVPLSDEQADIEADRLLFDRGFYSDEPYFRGFPSALVREAIRIARIRRGFLLGISPEIAETQGITLHNGDGKSSDIRVDTSGKGLAYALLSGIEPLGILEKQFLQLIF